MPKYRLKAEAHPSVTLGYKKATFAFSSDPKNAYVATLSLADARNWLDFTWGHVKASWLGNTWFSGRKLDDVRLVLEEVRPDDSSVVVAVSTNWTNKPVVTSGTATT